MSRPTLGIIGPGTVGTAIGRLAFEFNYDNHRSKPVFMMDIMYYGSLVCLNILLLLKH